MPDELFRNGDYRGISLSVRECKSLLARRGVSLDAGCREKEELVAAVNDSSPPIFDGQPPPILGKWKTSYACAELDRHREMITEYEVSYFRWQLIYNGRPSTLGLRHFQRDGIFVSPHFGQTSWYLDQGNFIMQGVAPLQVRRNPDNWGWFIGHGTNTEYHSIEVSDTH